MTKTHYLNPAFPMCSIIMSSDGAFTILGFGDDADVSDETLLALHNGEEVDGWVGRGY